MRFSYLFCSLLLTSFCLAQQATIKGEVLDFEDKPAGGVEIHLVELDSITTSDSRGKFQFTNLPNRPYTLIPYYGSESYDPTYVYLREKNEENVNLLLCKMEFSLEEVRIQAISTSERLKNSAIKADIVTLEGNVHR